MGQASQGSEPQAKIPENGRVRDSSSSKEGTGKPVKRWATEAECIQAMNISNKPSEDSCVRGAILPSSSINEAVGLTTLILFVSWPYVFASLVIASLFSRVALAAVVVLATSLFLPAKLLWTDFTQCYMLRTWQEYFTFSWTLEKPLPSDQKFIFAEFPHGAFPFGPFLAARSCATNLPGHKVYALAASAVFYVPLYKHFMTWIGCLPASRSNLVKLLQKGSVAVVMGGIAEMFMLRDDREEVLLRNRGGLMKTAIETGTPIVLVYYLGNSRILKFGPQWLKHVSRKLRTSLGFVFGKWGLPVPIKHHIEMVCGKPIIPEKLSIAPGQAGYEEALKVACARLTDNLADELQAMYKRHRHIVGWGEERPLIIH